MNFSLKDFIQSTNIFRLNFPIVNLLIIFLVIMFSIIAHEIAHGYIAYLSGDNTAKNHGRLSLNPFRHLDPIGVIVPIILFITGSSFIFGWAKPVPVNYNNLKNGRLGEFFVSIAGILTNFCIALLGVVLFISLKLNGHLNRNIIFALINLIRFNIMLGIFNLIPIPPLDGSKILASFMPSFIRNFIFSMDKLGFFILILLLWTGFLNKFLYSINSQVFSFLFRVFS